MSAKTSRPHPKIFPLVVMAMSFGLLSNAYSTTPGTEANLLISAPFLSTDIGSLSTTLLTTRQEISVTPPAQSILVTAPPTLSTSLESVVAAPTSIVTQAPQETVGSTDVLTNVVPFLTYVDQNATQLAVQKEIIDEAIQSLEGFVGCNPSMVRQRAPLLASQITLFWGAASEQNRLLNSLISPAQASLSATLKRNVQILKLMLPGETAGWQASLERVFAMQEAVYKRAQEALEYEIQRNWSLMQALQEKVQQMEQAAGVKEADKKDALIDALIQRIDGLEGIVAGLKPLAVADAPEPTTTPLAEIEAEKKPCVTELDESFMRVTSFLLSPLKIFAEDAVSFGLSNLVKDKDPEFDAKFAYFLYGALHSQQTIYNSSRLLAAKRAIALESASQNANVASYWSPEHPVLREKLPVVLKMRNTIFAQYRNSMDLQESIRKGNFSTDYTQMTPARQYVEEMVALYEEMKPYGLDNLGALL